MDFLKMLEDKREEITIKFEKCTEMVNEKKEQMETLHKEMLTIIDEQKRMQGEFRTIKELIDKTKQELGIEEDLVIS